MKVEFRIKKVRRYIITRYEASDDPDGDTVVANLGMFDNPDQAYHVMCALADHQARKLGLEPGSEMVISAEHPGGKSSSRNSA